jgi:hypothetical protein
MEGVDTADKAGVQKTAGVDFMAAEDKIEVRKRQLIKKSKKPDARCERDATRFGVADAMIT